MAFRNPVNPLELLLHYHRPLRHLWDHSKINMITQAMKECFKRKTKHLPRGKYNFTTWNESKDLADLLMLAGDCKWLYHWYFILKCNSTLSVVLQTLWDVVRICNYTTSQSFVLVLNSGKCKRSNFLNFGRTIKPSTETGLASHSNA